MAHILKMLKYVLVSHTVLFYKKIALDLETFRSLSYSDYLEGRASPLTQTLRARVLPQTTCRLAASSWPMATATKTSLLAMASSIMIAAIVAISQVRPTSITLPYQAHSFDRYSTDRKLQ